MKIEIIEAVTVYPDRGGKPVFLTVGEQRDDFKPEFAKLMIQKGHAKELLAPIPDPAPTPAPAEPAAEVPTVGKLKR